MSAERLYDGDLKGKSASHKVYFLLNQCLPRASWEAMEMRDAGRAATKKGMGRGKIKTFGAWESQEGYRGPMRGRDWATLGGVAGCVVGYVGEYVGE